MQLYIVYLFLENCSTCFGWYVHPWSGAHTGCNRRNGPDFGRVFLRSYYTDI